MDANNLQRVYNREVDNPRIADGEYLVSVRDNDEARLVLGLKLGEPYSSHDVCHAMFKTADSIKAHRSLTHADRYRLFSALDRLLVCDHLVS